MRYRCRWSREVKLFARAPAAAQVYGAKLWRLYPPHDAFFSLDDPAAEHEAAARRAATDAAGAPSAAGSGSSGSDDGACTFVQRAGDVAYVPFGWGHSIVNLADTVALAIEFVPGVPGSDLY